MYFYCHEAKLVIELDGDIHELEEIKEYDKNREALLKELELKVVRFTNEEVLSDPAQVIKTIQRYLPKK